MGNVFQDNDQGISFGVFSQDWAISNNLLNKQSFYFCQHRNRKQNPPIKKFIIYKAEST